MPQQQLVPPSLEPSLAPPHADLGFEPDNSHEDLGFVPDSASAATPSSPPPSILSRVWQSYKSHFPSAPASDWPELGPKFRAQIAGVAKGIANIPIHSYQALAAAGDAISKGDLGGAAFHAAGAVPLIGPWTQEISQDVSAGRYPEAIGSGGALATQLLAPKLPETPGAIARGAAKTGRAVVKAATSPGVPQMAGGAAETALGAGMLVKGQGYGVYPLIRGIRDVSRGVKARRLAAEEAKHLPTAEETIIDEASRADWERLQARDAAAKEAARMQARADAAMDARMQAEYAGATADDLARLRDREVAARAKAKSAAEAQKTQEAEHARASQADAERLQARQAAERQAAQAQAAANAAAKRQAAEADRIQELEHERATREDVGRMKAREQLESMKAQTQEHAAAEASSADYQRFKGKEEAEAPAPALTPPPSAAAPTTFTPQSHVRAVEYNPTTQDLTITFHNGARYLHSGVPQAVVDKFKAAPSTGTAYHAMIKKYPMTKLDSASALTPPPGKKPQ